MKRLIIIILITVAILVVVARVGLSVVIDRGIAEIENGAAGVPVSFDRVESSEGALSTERRFFGVTAQAEDVQVQAETAILTVPLFPLLTAQWALDGQSRIEQPGQWVVSSPEISGQSAVSFSGQPTLLTAVSPTIELASPLIGVSALVEQAALDYRVEGTTQLIATAVSVTVPEHDLGIEDLSLDLEASPKLPDELSQSNMQRWRDGGGSVEKMILRYLFGGSAVEASGTLGLDEGLQPAGEGAVQIADFEKSFDLMVARGFLPEDQSTLMRFAIAVMAQADEDGDPAMLTLPWRIEDSILYAGEFQLIRIDPINWPN